MENHPLLTNLKSRPVRHKENFDLFHYEEAMDIYNEFFRFHPNGVNATKDYLVIKLSDEMVTNQLNHIRMSSYRWVGVKPAVEGIPQGEESFACPDSSSI